MKVKCRKDNTPSKKRMKATKPEASLDDTLQSIFEDVDEHFSTMKTENVENSYIVINKNHGISDSKYDVDQESAMDSNQSMPIISGIKSFAQSSKSMKTKMHLKKLGNGNHITLNRESLEKAIDILSSQPEDKKKKSKADLLKTKFHRTCHEGYDYMLEIVHWQSYAFMVRAIRNLILERDWAHLKEMLRMMLKQPKILKNYIKEITHLYFLINADEMDPVVIENYFTFCFSIFDGTQKPIREFDIWFNDITEY